MINFFRKTRKKLADENKPLKYARYAIGEILLVVIGILIALQINNWNESRKTNILEHDYLKRLKHELEDNIEYAESQIYVELLGHNCANRILSTISESSDISNSHLLAYSIVLTGWTNRVDYINNVWNELYSTGNARLISNSDLRKQLIEVQRKMGVISHLNEEFNGFNLGFRRLVGDVLNGILQVELSTKLQSGWGDAMRNSILNDELSTDLLRSEMEENINKLPSSESIKEKLSEIKGIEGYLADIIQGSNKMMHDHESIIQTFKQIIDIIDDELNVRSQTLNTMERY